MSENSPAPAGDASSEPSAFGAGIEDAILLPLAAVALAARTIGKAIFSILITILDYAFPIVLQLVRLPLFAIRSLGDATAALLSGLIRWLPASAGMREHWRALLMEHWAKLRQYFSYRAFEAWLHHAFESGMGWVFRKCRTLTPSGALLVIGGAILWIPISFGAATALHAVLIVQAMSLPPWMQLLHPCATLIAKTKILVLPVYPAAWPQAKKHPFVQAIFGFYERAKNEYLVRKTRHRYRQVDRFFAGVAANFQRIAAAIGVDAVAAKFRDAMKRMLAPIASFAGTLFSRMGSGLAKVPLVGSIVTRYAAEHESRDHAKLSRRASEFFARWSIHFSPEYYEARELRSGAGSDQLVDDRIHQSLK